MDWTLIYGFLIVMGLFFVVWFALVVPSERRDHERRLAIVRKRIAERQSAQQEKEAMKKSDDTGSDDG